MIIACAWRRAKVYTGEKTMPASKKDRKWMEMAVEEMRQSRSEHTDERDPMVGAVLVDLDGKLLGATHRGSLRVGNHAEYTLIERYLRDKNLEGSTLYLTLEPCTSRGEGKTPCAKWIIGARIGRVFIGMPDPNPNILGRGIDYLMKNRVEVGFFDTELTEQIRDANQTFIAYYENADRLTANAESFEGPSRKEVELVERASVDDFSHEALTLYVARRELNLTVPSEKLWHMMERAGYLGRTAAGKLVPTVAGVVLFAAQPAEISPQCRVSMEAKKAGRTVSGDFEGPLMGFRDHLDKFFKDNMRHFTEIQELDRVLVAEYPMEAIREAAFNGVVHRDYQAGARVHITLNESEIEVRSPGGLVKPLSLTQVRAFNAPPFSRNPHIAVAVGRMGWIEERGSGLARMRDTMVAHGLRPPFFDFVNGYFVVKLPGSEQTWTSVRVASGFYAKLEPHQRRIVDLVTSQGRLATRECAKRLKVSEASARRYMQKLVDEGILEPRGSGSNLAYWLVGGE